MQVHSIISFYILKWIMLANMINIIMIQGMAIASLSGWVKKELKRKLSIFKNDVRLNLKVAHPHHPLTLQWIVGHVMYGASHNPTMHHFGIPWHT